MVRRTTIRHDDVSVKEDLKHFFTNPDHRVYQKGTQADCGPDWPYYKTQLAVLFENDHFHWVTARAIDSLLEEGFLKSQDPEGQSWEHLKVRKGMPLVDTGRLRNSWSRGVVNGSRAKIFSNAPHTSTPHHIPQNS